MSSLHIWYSKLKWNMDVLLRFYERHAFVCALHKETRMLFDELVFCLQRLYARPFRTELLPFSNDLLDSIPERQTPVSAVTAATTPGSTASTTTVSSGASRKSRIPRPISLPKRLEAKLGGHTSPSPVRAASAKAAQPALKQAAVAASPTKAAGRKSRVRDTIRLFDSKNRNRPVIAAALTGGGGRAPPLPRRPPSGARAAKAGAPKTGGGEAMAAGPSGR